jgi:quercetin dioxygenase-like cupin family protein
MPARVFDWRDDPSGTLVVVPQVRARFLEFQPGQPMGNYHSHEESDGVETFVCMKGRFRFDIDGEIVEIGPGQAVFTYPPEKHRVEAVGDESAVMFLTVTPHRQPSHTHFDEQGQRLPSRPGVTAADLSWRGEPALGPQTERS